MENIYVLRRVESLECLSGVVSIHKTLEGAKERAKIDVKDDNDMYSECDNLGLDYNTFGGIFYVDPDLVVFQEVSNVNWKCTLTPKLHYIIDKRNLNE